MNTVNPTVNAQIEQMERELLDAIYEQGLTENPEISKVIREMKDIPKDERDESGKSKELLDRLEELTGGTSKSMADWLIQSLTVDQRVRKAREQYIMARKLLSGAGVL